MTDNTNDEAKTPKSRTSSKPDASGKSRTPSKPRAPRKTGKPAATAAEDTGTAGASGASGAGAPVPEAPGSGAPISEAPISEASEATPEPAARAGASGKPKSSRKTPRAAGAEGGEPAEKADVAERTEGAGKGTARAKSTAQAEEAGRTEQAARDARAEWFERVERARREERAAQIPWSWPGRRDDRPEPGEHAGRDEHAGAERARDERGRNERAGDGRGRDERVHARGAGDERARDTAKDPLSAAGEEAFKLFETLQQKAARELRKNLIKGTMTGLGGAFSGGGRGRERDVWEEAVSDHEEYICRACPVCRAMAAQRESGGAAVTDHLLQAGTELFAAFKSAVDGIGRPASGDRARERERDETPVEHIDLG